MAKPTLVAKIGSNTLTDDSGRVDTAFIARVMEQVSTLRSRGWRVVIVSSGAIAAGVQALGLPARPTAMPVLQAVAAVGQVRLVENYADAAAVHGFSVGQVLLTRHDVGDRSAYVNACRTMDQLLAMGVVPVVNENDTTAVDEIRFGDNDYLAALVAMMVDASLCVFMTDIAGLYERDPREDPEARLVEHVDELSAEVVDAAGGPGSSVGSGGMASKLEAARVLMDAGIPLVICDGRRPDVLVDAVEGHSVGTLFAGGKASRKARKLWLAYAGRPAGRVVVDAGARDALCLRGTSLLPAGVVDVQGAFDAGEAVAIMDRDGDEVARGLAGMSSADLRRVMGLRSDDIRGREPALAGKEVVHRDHLVILRDARAGEGKQGGRKGRQDV
ncbi:MAG: glutamate 5-kinase [Coriobacteriia bacterium]|nr:glutamate 5-kinase [Coriobacteriia bacterium]